MSDGQCRKLYLLGHSHLDVAWLWPTSETREVFIKTVENVLELMRKYPGFTFAQSTALYYDWLRSLKPELLEEVKRRVREGRWEVVGGSWVECDCILPSGEGLVRQFLYGKRFLRRVLGVDVRVAWFPDSFGFPASLPQILVGCGIKYFVTQKLNWNDSVMFPYNLFRWSSPDGSEVLAYQTVGGYWGNPGEVWKVASYVQAMLVRHGMMDLLLLYGSGDHGCGPKEEEVAAAEALVREVPRELRSLGIDGAEHSLAETYLRRVEEVYGEKIPKYEGELYLQFHRGTYTSQVRVKELVKECEYLLEVLEKLLTLKLLARGETYDREEVESLWREVLVAHFHDAMAGSVSKTPYLEFLNSLTRLRNRLRARIENLIAELMGASGGGGDEGCVVAFNPLPRAVSAYLEVPGQGLVKASIPPLALTVVRPEAVEGGAYARDEGDYVVLGNGVVELRVSKATGEVKSLRLVREGLEVLGGRGLGFEVYDDTPRLGRATVGTLEKPVDYVFDCWELYYLQRLDGVKYKRLTTPVRVIITESGPLRASVTIEYLHSDEGGDVAIKHHLRVYAEEPWVEGIIEVEWGLTHRVLKLVADLSIWAENIVVGQPYGHAVRRNPASPYSTLYDRAMWEAWFNRWIDFSDGEKGLALICGARFGYDVMGRTLRLTILRGPKFPPEGMQGKPWIPELLEAQEPVEGGRYRVTYYLYPHAGDWVEGKVPTKAEELLSRPYVAVVRGASTEEVAPVEVSVGHVEIPVLKACEESDECVVVRAFNPYGREGSVTLRFREVEVVGAERTNMLEERLSEARLSGDGSLALRIEPFKVATYKLMLKHRRRGSNPTHA